MVIMSGTTPKCCGGERLAQAAEAGDHLVEDEQDAVPRADLAQPLEVALRRHQHAGRAGHRLDDHRRDGRWIVQREQALELVGELGAVRGLPSRERVPRQVVRVRGGGRRRRRRAEHLAVRRDAADRDAAEVDAVVAALAADEAEALRLAARAVIGERDLERGVDRLGARVGEEDAREAGRRDAREPLGELEGERMAHLEGGRVVHLGAWRCIASTIFGRQWPALHAPQARRCRRAPGGRRASSSTCPRRARAGAAPS